MLAAALAVTPPARALPVETEGVALRRAETEYRLHLLRARPDLATRFGVRGAEAKLVPVTEATLRDDPAWLAAMAARLAAIDGRRLPAGEAARLDSLRRWVARERAPHESGAWARDPSPYLELGPGAVLEAASLPGTGACTRARFATGRLRALPEVLRAARVTLRDLAVAGPDAAEALAAPWRAAMDSLRALPSRLGSCREPAREADLVEADSLALAACERFVRFLREERGGASPPRGRGAGERP